MASASHSFPPQIDNPAILSLIGRTPLLEITRFDTGVCQLFIKLETQNPTGSIKDRMALAMVEAAEQHGDLKPGGTIIEATAGNTGLGLALVAAAKGYHLLLVIPDKMSQEKILHLRALGAHLRRGDLRARRQRPGGDRRVAAQPSAGSGPLDALRDAQPAARPLHRAARGGDESRPHRRARRRRPGARGAYGPIHVTSPFRHAVARVGARDRRLVIGGSAAPGYDPVVRAFAQMMASGDEAGVAFAAVVDGVPVVDLWAGIAQREPPRPCTNTIGCVPGDPSPSSIVLTGWPSTITHRWWLRQSMSSHAERPCAP